MSIIFHKDFTKNFKKFSPKMQEKFYKKLSIFEVDEFNPTLNNHALKGSYLGFRSINVTCDLRAIFSKNGEEVTFVTLDSHSNLYS